MVVINVFVVFLCISVKFVKVPQDGDYCWNKFPHIFLFPACSCYIRRKEECNILITDAIYVKLAGSPGNNLTPAGPCRYDSSLGNCLHKHAPKRRIFGFFLRTENIF